jgi:hypothetical protein
MKHEYKYYITNTGIIYRVNNRRGIVEQLLAIDGSWEESLQYRNDPAPFYQTVTRKQINPHVVNAFVGEGYRIEYFASQFKH